MSRIGFPINTSLYKRISILIFLIENNRIYLIICYFLYLESSLRLK